MPLQQGPRFYIPLESTCCSFVTENHTMDLFYLLTENFKNLLVDSSQEGSSRICLIYQVVRCNKEGDLEEYIRTYYEALNKTLLTQNYQG